MCVSIICEGVEMLSIRDAKDHFGEGRVFIDPEYGSQEIPDEGCLCPMDAKRTAAENGYRIVEHDGDPMEVRFQRLEGCCHD